MQTITDRTEEFLSVAACRMRLAFGNAAHAIAARGREERGQISAEFMGLLFIVALIIAAIVALDIDEDISKAVDGFIGNIKKGEKPEG